MRTLQRASGRGRMRRATGWMWMHEEATPMPEHKRKAHRVPAVCEARFEHRKSSYIENSKLDVPANERRGSSGLFNKERQQEGRVVKMVLRRGFGRQLVGEEDRTDSHEPVQEVSSQL